jgi:predicted PhzF superfamily epimerase YddE/YHI9
VAELDNAKFFITINLDAGYWQILVEPSSLDKLAFFTPNDKKHPKVMSMGLLNAHSVFVAMITKLGQLESFHVRIVLRMLSICC